MLDGEGVFYGGGEGFFDHHGDVERGGLLDGGAVVGDGGVDEDGLGVRALEHRGFGGEEEIGGEVGAVDVVLAEGGVGVGDAYKLDLGVRREVVEEALDVAVDEADDGYSDGGWGLGGCAVVCEAGGEETGGEEEVG